MLSSLPDLCFRFFYRSERILFGVRFVFAFLLLFAFFFYFIYLPLTYFLSCFPCFFSLTLFFLSSLLLFKLPSPYSLICLLTHYPSSFPVFSAVFFLPLRCHMAVSVVFSAVFFLPLRCHMAGSVFFLPYSFFRFGVIWWQV